MEEANQNSEFKNFDFDKSKNKSKSSGDLLISLKKASYGKVKVLEDIEIKFPSTGTTAIIGDSGSGKTSLINCILGFINNYEGNILMSGKNLKTTPINFWRKNIGYVPQENILLNRTIKENISWGKLTLPIMRLLKLLSLQILIILLLNKKMDITQLLVKKEIFYQVDKNNGYRLPEH